MKTYTYIRESWWDSEFGTEYDVFHRTDSEINGTCYTESRLYINALLEEGVVDWTNIQELEAMTIFDLERLCLDNNIYLIIEDEKED